MLITVFTATFNRYNELKRVYECLKLQTYHDFEWIIVNDGSSDNTDELVNMWISERLLDIKYYYQSNQGKHIAFNYGVGVANGKMFVNLDSDDEIIPNALELFVKYWGEIQENEQVFFKGLAFRCMNYQTKEVLGQALPKMIWDSDDRTFRLKDRIKGEFIRFNRVDLLRKYPFPELDDRIKFYPENIIWFEMAKKYKTRYVDIPVRSYFLNTGNALTGKSHNRAYANYFLWKYYVNSLSGYFFFSPFLVLKGYLGISMDGFKSGRSFGTIISDSNGLVRKLFVIIFSPAGYILSRL